MIPLWTERFFAQLHPAGLGRAVVICPPLGEEALQAHRPLVMLAESLAAAGITALRLSYFGTGDAPGSPGEKPGLAGFTDSILAAVDWLRAQGAVSIGLCGLRFGAAMASLAAQRDGAIAQLALLAPVLSGRMYLRELAAAATLLADTWRVSAQIQHEGWLDAMGVQFDPLTQAELRGLDLRQLPPCAAQVLVLAPGIGQAEALAGLGIAARLRAMPDLAALLRDSHESAPAPASFAATVEFFAAGMPQAPALVLENRASLLRMAHGEESAVAPGPGMFGIFCAPAERDGARPVVLILNTGANPHTGNGRLAVSLARRLAAAGVASLRCDVRGVGDSDPASGMPAHPYGPAPIADIQAAIAWLAEWGMRRIVLLGLCSGAFTAFHAARGNPHVCGAILVNQQRFIWDEDLPLSVVQSGTLRTTHAYVADLRRRETWLRLLRGGIAVRRIGLELARRIGQRGLAALQGELAPALFPRSRYAVVRRWVAEMDRRQTALLIVLSGHDPGIDELERYFGSWGKRARRFRGVEIALLDDADHVLSSGAARARLSDLVQSFVARHCAPAQEPAAPEFSRPTPRAELGGGLVGTA